MQTTLKIPVWWRKIVGFNKLIISVLYLKRVQWQMMLWIAQKTQNVQTYRRRKCEKDDTWSLFVILYKKYFQKYLYINLHVCVCVICVTVSNNMWQKDTERSSAPICSSILMFLSMNFIHTFKNDNPQSDMFYLQWQWLLMYKYDFWQEWNLSNWDMDNKTEE